MGLQKVAVQISQPRDVPGIQYLRGIAALMVVCFHLSMQLAEFVPGYSRIETLQSGVDIFFVISGFVMVYSTGAGTRMSAESFIRRRVARIVPLYWAATLGMILILLVAPSIVKSSKLGLTHAAASLLFLPAPNPANGTYIPLVTPGWTLELEMLFYAVFALAILFARGREWRVILYASLPMAALAMLGLSVRHSNIVQFYANSMLLEFVFGMLIGQAFRHWTPKASLAFVLIGIAAWFVMVLPPQGAIAFRCFRYGIPAAAIIAGGVFGRLPRWKALHRLGDISYSLYLSHFFVLSAFAQLWRKRHMGHGAIHIGLFYLAGVALSLVVAYCIWRWVERPLTELAKRLIDTKRGTPAPAGA